MGLGGGNRAFEEGTAAWGGGSSSKPRGNVMPKGN